MALVTFVDTMSGFIAAFKAPVLVTEVDIRNAGMEPYHTNLAVTHFHRLIAQLPGGFSLDQQSALDRLVRITLIFQDYASYRQGLATDTRGDDGKFAPHTESMIVDILDACVPICGVSQPISLPAPGAHPREFQVRNLVRQYNTFHKLVDDPSKRARALSKVVPDRHTRKDIAEGIDWPPVLKRSRSADDIFILRWKHDNVRALEVWEKEDWERRRREQKARYEKLQEGEPESEEEEKLRKREDREIDERDREERKQEENFISGKKADLRWRWPPGKGERREGRREDMI